MANSLEGVAALSDGVVKPTAGVGRQVHYWAPEAIGGWADKAQPFTATIIFVHPGGEVDLMITNHIGGTFPVRNVELLAPGASDHHGDPEHYATWPPASMPRQSS